MRFDMALSADLGEVRAQAEAYEAMGVDGVFTFEGQRDVFFPLVAAAEYTGMDIYTNVAIALPRSPMHLAYQAFDLHRLSGGRFALGLGSQIKPHITKRYSAVWDRPVAQMRELMAATKAIFACWQEGQRLDFRGDYYTFTLTTPIFEPDPLDWGAPPIWAGALGPRMTRMVAETADGILIHPFCSEQFLRSATMPAVAAGLAAAGRHRDDFTCGVGVIVGLHGDDAGEAEVRAVDRRCRSNLGFYGSTPAYRVVLDAHGWGELQDELNRLTKQGRWDAIGDVWDTAMVRTLSVQGTPAEAASEIRNRFDGLADRIHISLHSTPQPLVAELFSELRDGA
ncbi:TIGR03617 family F420-dependent LLM class oxidoreductase [Candidatus Poriferisocius sp.]|uniref:TIGR03617 family F420-dependent LLM class oxidoreductase n=1 Tax=Candidatus Poriferisocius sp. TaxID=3101276 RepID=UPI003B013F11